MVVVETGDSSFHSFLPKGICALLRIDGHQKFSESFVGCINWKYLNIVFQFHIIFVSQWGADVVLIFVVVLGRVRWKLGMSCETNYGSRSRMCMC